MPSMPGLRILSTMIFIADEDDGAELAAAHQFLAGEDNKLNFEHVLLSGLSTCKVSKNWEVRQLFLRTCQDLAQSRAPRRGATLRRR